MYTDYRFDFCQSASDAAVHLYSAKLHYVDLVAESSLVKKRLILFKASYVKPNVNICRGILVE
jgi:hypothetical protein